MANNYRFLGVTLTHTADTDIAAGDVVAVGTRAGVALVDIPAGGSGAVQMNGVFALPSAGEKIAAGVDVYVNKSGKITATKTDNTRVGYAHSAVTADDSTIDVKLDS